MAHMNGTTRFLLFCLLEIVVALAIFFLTGLMYVKKGKVAYLKKGHKVVKTLNGGFHYGLPLFYSRTRSYVLNEGRHYRVKTKDRAHIKVEGNVIDPKALESASPKLKTIVKMLYDPKKSLEQNEITLHAALYTVGFDLASLTVK